LSEGPLGADVVVVGDGATARVELGADRVDLMILDLALPGNDGLDLLSEVRADPAHRTLPVVVLSGTTDASIVQRSYDLGANCFVRKPRRVVELVPAVRAIEQFWIRHSELPPLIDHGSSTTVSLPLPATADGVREARATVRRLLEGWGLAGLGETAELCASELATNAVLHARSPVLLGVELLPDAVRVEVEDEAPGAIEAGPLVDDGSESGRGLAIVDALTESWGVEQHQAGKTVWFELRRPDPV
jgi:CheY-like chemotaxis protein/anti-sigma regulatory factor (Ser/Thr protein kinase)